MLGDRSGAEDVVQEAAVVALGKLTQFDPSTSFTAWMGQIVRFVALNDRRKQQRRSRLLEVVPSEAPVAPAAAPALGFDAGVLRALQSLPEVPRTCVLLKTVLELEYSEIADVLGIPAGTAMSHVSRSRAKLARMLADPPPPTSASASMEGS